MSRQLVRECEALFGTADGQLLSRTHVACTVGAAGTAGTDLGETIAAIAPYDGRIVGVQFAANAAVAEHASNYATFTLEDAAGNVIASRDTDSAGDGGVEALTTDDLTPVAAQAEVSAGDPLVVDVIKAASGVATPVAIFMVEIEPR